VFAQQEVRMWLFVRTIGRAWATTKTASADPVCNDRRLPRPQRQPAIT
jgi:hypothetical protein